MPGRVPICAPSRCYVPRALGESGTTAGCYRLRGAEAAVATHAGAGRTNREIASLLFISTKTVETHLGAIYRKVNIESAPDLFERFRYRIPVIEVPGGPTLDWPTTPERVRRAILASASAR